MFAFVYIDIPRRFSFRGQVRELSSAAAGADTPVLEMLHWDRLILDEPGWGGGAYAAMFFLTPS